jgi:hypothetical protein
MNQPAQLIQNRSIPDLVETIRIHLGMAPRSALVGPSGDSVIAGYEALDELLRHFDLDPYTIWKDISQEQKEASEWLRAYIDNFHRPRRRWSLHRR